MQVSTASVGRFDKMLKGEASRTKGKRKQYETATDGSAATKARSGAALAWRLGQGRISAVDDTLAPRCCAVAGYGALAEGVQAHVP